MVSSIKNGFYTASSYTSQFEISTKLKTAQKYFTTIIREFGYMVAKPYNYFYQKNFYTRFNEKPDLDVKKKGLYICIHGLNGHSCMWNGHVHRLKEEKDYALYVPNVYRRGNCSLKEATAPILNVALEFAKKNPNSPICLMGVSNGGRIAFNIETTLREKAPNTPILTASTAGAHLGSSLMSFMNSMYVTRSITSFLYCAEVVDELQLNSKTNRDLIEKVNKPAENRWYHFTKADVDLMVPDVESSHPKIEQPNVCYVTIEGGYGHNSVVNKGKDLQIDYCVDWMRRHSS